MHASSQLALPLVEAVEGGAAEFKCGGYVQDIGAARAHPSGRLLSQMECALEGFLRQ